MVAVHEDNGFLFKAKKPLGGIERQPFGLFSLTVTDFDGNVRYKYGKIYEADYPYISHFADGMIAIDQVSGHTPRALVVGTDQNGGVLRTCHLDNNGEVTEYHLSRLDYTWVLSGRAVAANNERTIVLTTQDLGYLPDRFGSQSALFLDSNGKVITEVQSLGDGHFPACFDADGDGCDEFLLGYNHI